MTRMRILVSIAVTMVLAGALSGTDTPKMADSAKVKIMAAQLKMSRLSGEMQQLQARAAQIQAQFPEAQKELADADEQAYKESNVSKEDFSVDNEKLEFVALPKPVVPEAKKP
jgi:hypothetical protein